MGAGAGIGCSAKGGLEFLMGLGGRGDYGLGFGCGAGVVRGFIVSLFYVRLYII